MKANMKYLGGALLVIATLTAIILSGGNATITQGGTPDAYLEYTCIEAKKSIAVKASYVRLHDCEVVDSTSHGILIGGDGKDVHHVIVENNVVRNSITENGVYPNCGSNSWGSGIKIGLGAHDIIVRNNHVENVCGEGIAATRAPNVTIENNIVSNGWAGAIYTDASQATVISGNTVTCQAVNVAGRQSFGIMAGHEYYAGWIGSRDRVQILNNIVSGCSDGINVFNPEAGAVNTVFSNALIDGNIVVLGGRYAIHISSGVVTSNARISNNKTYILPTGKLAGVVLSNNTIYAGPVVTPPTSTPGAASTATRTAAPVTATRTAVPSITPTRTPSTVPVTGTPPILLWECTVSPNQINCKIHQP